MEKLALFSQIITDDLEIVAIRLILLFLAFYVTSSNLLILLIIINNWGKPMNFQIGMYGVKI